MNGSTNTDRTNYWEVVPANALELALWMESDRMGYLLPALTQAKFDEPARRRPERAATELREPAVRPVSHGARGSAVPARPSIPLADHRRRRTTCAPRSLDDVRAFFQRYYHPANASLAIAGDIDSPDALDSSSVTSVTSRRARRSPSARSARQARHGALVMEDRVELPRLYLAGSRRRSSRRTMRSSICWPTCWPTARARGSIGSWCTSGASRRTCRPYQNSRELAGFFQVVATAAPGMTLADARGGDHRRELGAHRSRRPDGGRDRARAVAQTEAHFVYRLQTVGGFGGKSDQLNSYNVFLGEPGYFAPGSAPVSRRHAAASCRGRGGWLAAAPRVPLSVVPRGRLELALPDSDQGGVLVTAVDRSRLPVPGPEPAFRIPEVRRHARQRPPRLDRRAARACRWCRSCCCRRARGRPVRTGRAWRH